MTDPPERWTPAFEGQRPPFPPGNDLATKHGAYSARVIEPRAREIVEFVLADESVAYLRDPAYQPALRAWAQVEAKCQILLEYLADKPLTDGKGPLPLLEQLRLWLTTAANHRARLGLDPVSRAKLAKDMAVTGALSGARSGLGELAERGRKARLSAEERRTLEAIPDEDAG